MTTTTISDATDSDSSFSLNNIPTNTHSAGLDTISIVIVIVCCLLIITVIVFSIWYYILNHKLKRMRERKASELQKQSNENDIEVDIKIEGSKPTKQKAKRREIVYHPQQDSIPTQEEKLSTSSIFRQGDKSHLGTTSRNLLNKTDNNLSFSKPDKNLIIDFMQDESEIHHVDVSFKGGDHDKSMITYEKKIGNLPLNDEKIGKRIIENKLYKDTNSEEIEDDSQYSEGDDENYAEKKENVVKHHQESTKKLYNYNDEIEMKHNYSNNYLQQHQNHNYPHGIDDNQYMTANFVNIIDDFENNIDSNNFTNKNNKSYGKKDSFGSEDDKYNKNSEDMNGEVDTNEMSNKNTMRDSTSYINELQELGKFKGGQIY